MAFYQSQNQVFLNSNLNAQNQGRLSESQYNNSKAQGDEGDQLQQSQNGKPQISIAKENQESSEKALQKMNEKDLKKYLAEIQKKNKNLKKKFKPLEEKLALLQKIGARNGLIQNLNQQQSVIANMKNELQCQINIRKATLTKIEKFMQDPLTYQKVKGITFFQASILYEESFEDTEKIKGRQPLKIVYDESKTQNVKVSVEELKNKHNFDMIRKVRGDGNCYYRAVCYAYIEHLIRLNTPISELQQFIYKLSQAQDIWRISYDKFQLRANLLKLLIQIEQNKIQNKSPRENLELLFQKVKDNQDYLDEAMV